MPALKTTLIAVIVALLAIVVTVVGLDWRLWHRYLTQPDDITDPANALWFSPRAALADGNGSKLVVRDEPDRTLPADALEGAWQYAQSMGTDALIIARDGVIELERYGPGIDQATLFQSQSLHKGLTAMALGAAIHNGAIASADVAASSLLPEWLDSPAASRATLAQLAHMQAGLERPRYANHPFSKSLQMFLSGNVSKRALSTPFVAEPGDTFIWSNASTQALSIAIERAVGIPWHQFISQNLWVPMGGGEAYVQLDSPEGTAYSFCCLISNARNWFRVGQLLLDDGIAGDQRLLPEHWVSKMTTGSSTNPNYGMQLWLNEPAKPSILRNGLPKIEIPRGQVLAATDAFYIEGHFAQRIHVVPSAGLVVVRLGDDRRDWNDASLMNGLIDAVQMENASTPLPPATPPATDFDDQTPAPGPDYSNPRHWAAYPSEGDPPTHAFYVYPTTYPGPTWNSDLDNRETRLGADAVVRGQASVLNDCCSVYAPYYRQAASAAVMDWNNGAKAYDFAYRDVLLAFERFRQVTNGEPFLLMGHSQGAFHLQRLITEEIIPRGLSEQLIAAYIIGISLPQGLIDAQWDPLSVCASPDQTGCIMTWVTFGPGADVDAYQRRLAQRYPQYADDSGGIELTCANPLSGSSAAADPATNLGAVPPPVPGAYLSAPTPKLVGASCDQGILRLTSTPGKPYANLIFPGENYHFYDVALFYENVRQDAATRAAAMQNNPG